jgi:hypothetical protein
MALEPQTIKQRRTLKEIYKGGMIEFTPVLKISLDSIPGRIQAKTLIKLVQGTDKLYVSDLGLHDVKAFKLNGKFIKKFGIEGRGPGDLLAPSSMCISKKRLVVWEIRNRRFSFFSLAGKFIKIVKPGLKGRLEGMKALDDGRLILELTRVEANKSKKEIFEWRVLELYSSDLVFIKEIYRQKEHRYKYFKNPRPHYRLGLPFLPRLYWDVLPGGKVATSFTAEYEIKIMDVDSGRTKTISRDHSTVKILEADKNEHLKMYFNREGGVLKRGPSKFIRDNIEFPEFKPAINKIITDVDGHIIVFPFLKSDGGKSPLLAHTFDVFDSNGSFINHVKIKNNKNFTTDRVISVKNNEFWCSETDDEFDISFVKYEAM